MAKIIHQREKCAGCGVCVMVCSKFFEMDSEDHLALLKNSKKINGGFELIVESMDCAGEAADMCPAKIIRIEKD